MVESLRYPIFFCAGELCEQFSVLVRVLHSGQFRYVSPTTFKKTVGRFKSDFAGFDQQDSQELLSFLMEALHEDTNRVSLTGRRITNSTTNKKPFPKIGRDWSETA